MKNKILYLVFLLPMLGVWSSCRQTQTISYEFTEKDSPFDTVIVVENMKQYHSVDIETVWEWDDTVILSGIKRPAQYFTVNRVVGNYDNKDTIRITFDKYKAKKAHVRSKKTFMPETCID